MGEQRGHCHAANRRAGLMRQRQRSPFPLADPDGGTLRVVDLAGQPPQLQPMSTLAVLGTPSTISDSATV